MSCVDAGGPAVNVRGPTLGDGNLNFQSVRANGGANGILLNNTGSSGGLIVTGDGGNANNGSGGTIQNMTGDTGAAWNDPVKGGEITKSQIAQGSDVVYAAAGGTGIGVLQAAADAKILSIGVDANQNYLHPGKVLTSMLKRVDVAVYNVMKGGNAGFKPGVQALGLAEDGVGVAMDDNNKPLITPEMLAAFVKAELAKWTPVAKATGVQLD